MHPDIFRIAPHLIVATTNVGHPGYDFDFRRYLDVRSVMSADASDRMLVRLGAIADYGLIEDLASEVGCSLVNDRGAHLRASELPEWYPLLNGLTPESRWFDVPPTISEVADLGWPVFVKGHRQTNRHRRSMCIAENENELAAIFAAWATDPILHWQKLVCRRFVPLVRAGHADPGSVPASVEMRAFLWRGEVVAIAPYWRGVRVSESEQVRARRLAEEAASRVKVDFLVVDVALALDGRWIVVECNDAQESGYVDGLSPLAVWNGILAA